MKLCEHCKIWRPCRSDIWCSWCGARLVGIRASLSQTAYTHDQWLPARAVLTLESESESGPIALHAIETSDPWITVEWGGHRAPLVLEPRQRIELKCRVTPNLLPRDAYSRGYIVLRSSVGKDELAVDVTPPREVSVECYGDGVYRKPCEFDLILDGRPLEQNLLRVSLGQGIGKLEGIDTDAPDLVKVRTAAEEALPVWLDAHKPERASLDLKLDVDEDKLMSENAACPSDRTVKLELRFADEAVTENIVLHLWRAPELQIPDEHDYSIPVLAGQMGAIALTLQNRGPVGGRDDRGNSPLIVSRIDVALQGRPADFLEPPEDVTFPLVVPGGAERSLVYRFATREGEFNGDKALGLGTWPVSFELVTNYPQTSRRIQKEIRVEKIPDFEGVLAIDLGTSNSCVGFFRESGHRRGVVPVAGEETTPTLIQYVRPAEAGRNREVRIGSRVITTIYTPKNIRSIVRSPKLRLGEEGRQGSFQVAYYETDDLERLPARSVAADYLRAVRAEVEAHLKARCRHIVFTHPSDFEPRQIQDLKAAVSEAFGHDCRLKALPEPVAAALSYMFRQELLELGHYTLAVFDFGGGTTDLSLLQVENRRVGDRIEVHPRQTQFNGHVFGGQNLTGFIEEYAWDRCQDFVRKDETGAQFTRDRSVADGSLRLLATANSLILFEWAERIKLALIEQEDEFASAWDSAGTDDFPNLQLQIKTPAGVRMKSFPYREVVPSWKEFLTWFDRQLERLASDLIQMARASGLEHPDYVLLSGKSSEIPRVKSFIEQTFGGAAKVHLSAEPKQCVVNGACVPYVLSFADDLILDLGGGDAGFVRTTRRIGYAKQRAGRDGLEPHFREVFPRGTAIPEDGLQAVIENYPLRHDTQLRIMQNASTTSDEVLDNPNVKDIGVYVAHPAKLALRPGERVNADLLFRISQGFEIEITAKLKDGHEIPFIPRNSAAQGA